VVPFDLSDCLASVRSDCIDAVADLGIERFTSIDVMENNGLDLVGRFHSDQWGDFRTYFKFQLSPTGKIKRLDIGQAT